MEGKCVFEKQTEIFSSVPAALDPCSLPFLIHLIQSLFQSLHQKEPKGLSPPVYVEESSDKEAGTSVKENQDAYQWLFEICSDIFDSWGQWISVHAEAALSCRLSWWNNHSFIDSCPSWGQSFSVSEDKENHYIPHVFPIQKNNRHMMFYFHYKWDCLVKLATTVSFALWFCWFFLPLPVLTD